MFSQADKLEFEMVEKEAEKLEVQMAGLKVLQLVASLVREAAGSLAERSASELVVESDRMKVAGRESERVLERECWKGNN